MKFDIKKVDLSRINSLTKYPSIVTYHKLDPKNGGLIEEPLEFKGTLVATEKIDGTNARIICLPDNTYLLGSREELLYAKGDLIGNPALGIIEALKTKADEIEKIDEDIITVFYCEVYGGKVTQASKQYTGERRVGYRLFDIAKIRNYNYLLEKQTREISSWRDHGGQSFVDESELQGLSKEHQFELTPRIAECLSDEFPTDIESTLAFLKKTLSVSQCLLDETGGGKPEGLVVRTLDRSWITKLRFQDYERTLKRRK
jgi:hypothetical protein